jgi:hypothetical protein
MIDLAITKMLEWESGSLLNSTGPWGKVVVYFSAMFVLPGSALLGEGGWWLSHTSKTINGFDGTHYTLLDNLAILFLPPILSMRYHGIFLFGDDVTIADAVIKVAPMVSSM